VTYICGIDPGVTGALAIHRAGRLVDIIDLPVLGGRVDGRELHEMLSGEELLVFLEDTHAMPKNGSIASFSLGLNTGIIIGVVESLSHPLVRVRPAAWKKKMSVTRQDKNALRGVVRELYPDFADYFTRVKDHNRAEAVLISRYGVAMNLQEANHD